MSNFCSPETKNTLEDCKSSLEKGEHQLDPEKSGLKPVWLLLFSFLFPSFFRRKDKKGKK